MVALLLLVVFLGPSLSVARRIDYNSDESSYSYSYSDSDEVSTNDEPYPCTYCTERQQIVRAWFGDICFSCC